MTALDWAILPVLGFFSYVLLSEVRVWLRRRGGDASVARGARWRLARRSLGVFLVLAIVVLVRYPWHADASWVGLLLGLIAALLLCFLLFVVAVVDFRAIRREIQSELESLNEKSVRELRYHLEQAVREASENDSEACAGEGSCDSGQPSA